MTGSNLEAEFFVPETLQEPVAGALAWINDTQQKNFKVTGLVDCDQALTAAQDQPFEMGLVLCDGELCIREQIRCVPQRDANDTLDYVYTMVDAAPRDVPPLLDPPIGLRSRWLTEVLGQHEFVLLLFYRGLW